MQEKEKDHLFSNNFHLDKSNFLQTVIGSAKKNTIKSFKNDYTPITHKSFTYYDTEAEARLIPNSKKNKDGLSNTFSIHFLILKID